VTSAASAGGAGGASGVWFQDRVFGWAAVAMVAEQPLLAPNLVGGNVVRVGAQIGFHVDDVAVLTDAGNYALFQAKTGMSLGTTENSPLAKAVKQAVEQYLTGLLPTEGGPERPVDPLRDALVLCTDSAAPATVRVHLSKAVSRTGSQPSGMPFGRELTGPESKALTVVLEHARRFWVAFRSAAPTDEELRCFLRALRVLTIDANVGESNHSAAVAILSTTLPDKTKAAPAWTTLVEEGRPASRAREWRDRAAIRLALSREGVLLSPPHQYSGDIEKLRDLSSSNLGRLASEAVLPGPGELHIDRSVRATLATDTSDTNVLIVGDAGAGKSAVAQEFVAGRASSQDAVALRAADIVGANQLHLDAPLASVLRAWTGSAGIVLIDGIDALRGSEDREFLSGVVADLRGSRWQVVATVRTFDARNNHALREAFSGPPVSVDPGQVDIRLDGVRHLLVGDLTDTELDTVVGPPLGPLLAQASPELQALLRNPFNLRLAAQLGHEAASNDRPELLAIRSRIGLLNAYWDRRVRNEDSTAREALLARLCRKMVSSRSLRVTEAEPVVRAGDSAAVQAMLSEGVLSADAGVPGARRVLSFSHNILFDYATALHLLHDPVHPSGLLNELDADPSLPLVARPSFDVLADLLWEDRDTGAFWLLCLDIAGSSHVLASLAFAARLLGLIRTTDDIERLTPDPGQGDQSVGLMPAQQLVRQLIGALRAPAVLADPTPAVVPLAALAHRLAENAGVSYSDAALAADLLHGLQVRAPLRAGDPGADDRGQAVAALLDGCRTDPQRMEPLAGFAARQLPHAVAASVAARDAAYRLLDDDNALGQWGGTALARIAESVLPAIPQDRDLALRMATTVLTFEETRDEQVSLGGSVLLSMNESRRQQAKLGVHVLERSFGSLCTADLRIAAEVFCWLADDGYEPQSTDQWPISVPGATGWLQYGRDLSTFEHGSGAAAVTLAAALAKADPASGALAVAVLVRRLHGAAAWAAVMTPADAPAALGRVFLPALDSGALLAHDRTHAVAAGLLAALCEHEPALAGRVESAVLHAHELVDANGGSQETKDALIGCLRRDGIKSAALAARLAELGPDGPPEVLHVPAPSRLAWGQWGDDPERRTEPETAVESAARTLREEVSRALNGTDQRAEPEGRLPELFMASEATFASCLSLPEDLELLLVEAAAILAADQRVVPGTSLGERVLGVLTAAKKSPHAGSLLSGGFGWSPSTRDTAMSGLAALLKRKAWRDSEAGPSIASWLSAAIQDSEPVVRLRAAAAMRAVHADVESAERVRAIGELMIAESDPTVRAALFCQLRPDAVGAPEAVDAVLERLLGEGIDAIPDPDTDLGEWVLEGLTYLALIPKASFALLTVERWCREAPAHPAPVKAFAQCARRYLNPPDGDGQVAAFHLLNAAATASLGRWTRNPSEHLPGADQSDGQLRASAEVAHEVAQQIYFASGAYAENPGEEPHLSGNHAVFADLAFPVLATCAKLGVPQCLHHAVRTMIFLAPLDEARALRAVAEAVPADGSYTGDYLVGEDLIPYLERLLAEQRQLVLVEEPGVAAFRHLLAAFAGAGNEAALALAYTFGDVFR
jgi:hypothetical protein